MRNINGDLDSGICTVFLMPPRNIAEVSSSMVKGLVGPKGWKRVVKKYVPMLARSRIYATDFFAAKYEQRARRNLEGSIRQLKRIW